MPDESRALIVSYGSIGQRHVEVLSEMGLDCAVVTSQPVDDRPVFQTISEALDQWLPHYVVVASPTSRHSEHIESLRAGGFRGPLLVEKPLFRSGLEIPPIDDPLIFVGFNLRFLSVIAKLKQLLTATKILTISIWNAQYLPEWRPNRDYRQTSSARSDLGGGVLRDLSHDFDLLLHIFGPMKRVSAQVGRFGDLEIDTDDTVVLWGDLASGARVAMYLSYLDRMKRHEIRITSSEISVSCNLLTGEIVSNSASFSFPSSRHETFIRMHSDVLSGKSITTCTMREGVRVSQLIDAIEHSSIHQETVLL